MLDGFLPQRDSQPPEMKLLSSFTHFFVHIMVVSWNQNYLDVIFRWTIPLRRTMTVSKHTVTCITPLISSETNILQFCLVLLVWQKLHTFKYTRYIIISSSGVSGMWSCTRPIMWLNGTRCISVLFEIWSRNMSSCVSIRVSILTKELSRRSLCSSADYWGQKFLQKHHTLHISLSSSMFYSVTILSILSSFFPSHL